MKIEVFGFGSFFSHPQSAKDIDLLFLFESGNINLVDFAVWLKRALKERLPQVDIVMLSKEEEEFDFINASYAQKIMDLDHSQAQVQLKVLTGLIDDLSRNAAATVS
ncbi:MAG: hypothetical protein A2426_12700 [Candidatus Lambdaproteobacteria bacterium RIFOXYC1_FULL_56_13]|nr:MAG: hypothetical protein A2426_12700 [Candidatus Lambdaproteobacteria bacterium RIFOXYC1_FULL_56_13]